MRGCVTRAQYTALKARKRSVAKATVRSEGGARTMLKDPRSIEYMGIARVADIPITWLLWPELAMVVRQVAPVHLLGTYLAVV
jgi:hypothetical protein